MKSIVYKILYELEAELVNQASVPNLDPLQNLLNMYSCVIDAANALKLLEKMFAPNLINHSSQFMAIRKRILYYLAHFEYMVREERGMEAPTTDDLKQLYPDTSLEDWSVIANEVIKMLGPKSLHKCEYQIHLN